MRGRQITLRQADAALAERYLGWRWVSGTGPVSFGWSDSDWLLPEGMRLPDVQSDQWELLDARRQGKVTLKSLPPVTSDIAAAWMLAELLDDVEVTKVGGRWQCRIGAVVATAETAPLAISRAAFKVGR